MSLSPKEAIKKINDLGVKMIDFKFIDFVGTWQHFTIPVNVFEEDIFEKGLGFDGSSMRAWAKINRSDMLLVPDPNTLKLDPFVKVPTASFVCDIKDPSTMLSYAKDPRSVARRAEEFVKSLGLADAVYIGPEAEFFIFDDVRFSETQNASFYSVDSNEGAWNTGRNEAPNLGYKPRYKEGYFPVPPMDSLNDIRNEMVLELQSLGMTVEAQHHEVASGGQSEIDLKFDTLLKMADDLMYFKYVIKNVAHRNGKTATFMPKPIFGDNGSGMHVHISLWKDGKPLFAGNEYGGFSKEALYFIGGLIKHGRSLTAITNPTTNSYKRLVPGYEAPVHLAYSLSNRSAAIRLPGLSASPNSKRIEFRPPDPSTNPYLAFSAILMAGLDGIKNKMDPGEALEKNIYGLSKEELRAVPSTPASLEEALNELEKDHDYLLEGGVFTEELISTWIEYKRENELKPVSMRPTPHEFALYFDI